MSLNFTVPKIEAFQSLPDGHYTAQLDHIEYMRGDFGNFHIVNWKILNPSEFEGKVHQERFNVEHENDAVRHIAIQNFGKFCIEIGGLKEGDDPKESDFLYKIATITIRNKTAKDGKVYANVIKRELINQQVATETAQTILNDPAINGIAGSGMQPFQAPTLPSDALNDGVPF